MSSFNYINDETRESFTCFYIEALAKVYIHDPFKVVPVLKIKINAIIKNPNKLMHYSKEGHPP